MPALNAPPRPARAGSPRRALHRGHFAFMRAVIQGIDARQAWSRYLQGEDDRVDERLIRRAINTYRDELAAAARRHARPGTARLVLMDASRVSDTAVAPPRLEDFALERGLEDFSLEDQLAAYEEVWGAGRAAPRQSQRRRLVERQLQAVAWLEGLSSRTPAADDPVEEWLAPALARRIAAAGMPTLRSLVARIQAVGTRWWSVVPAIGTTKAARVVDWLRAHQEETGLPLGAHVFAPISQASPAVLNDVMPAATALRPLEKFVVPPALRGQNGRFRAPSSACRIAAEDDLAAIEHWLRTRGRGAGAGTGAAASEETRRAYRKEAERLLLWAVLERQRALSSLDEADCAAFIRFVRSPPASWCGPRHRERWSPLWRPLEGPLRGAALQRCMAVLRGLFRFLHTCGYLAEDPSAGLTAGAADEARDAPSSVDADPAVLDMPLSARLPATRGLVRARRAAAWLRETNLKPGELARGRCADLVRPEEGQADAAAQASWMLRLRGRAAQGAVVRVPHALVAELSALLTAHGRPDDPTDTVNAELPLLFDVHGGQITGLSRGGIYKAIKRLLHHCSGGLAEAQRQALLRSSPQRLGRGAARSRGRGRVILESAP